MPGASARGGHRRVRRVTVRWCGGAALAAAAFGCDDPAAAVGQRGPSEFEPRAGQYAVADFAYWNACAEPAYGLSSQAATARSAAFEFAPEANDGGAVTLAGALHVTSPATDTGDVVILEGPDTGRYRISGDTLRLLFARRVNGWVGVLRFGQYRGGQLAGMSQTSCRTLSLRLERRP